MPRPPLALSLFILFISACPARAADFYQTDKPVRLDNVNGRIDHLAVDVAGHRLFVAELGNNTLDVIDTQAGKVLQRIDGLPSPQGVAYLPDLKRLAVACGGDGSLRLFDEHLKPIKQIDLQEDADNIRYDAAAQRLYVGHASAMAVIDPIKGTQVADIQLPGHPEAFALETRGPRLFVNVPSNQQVSVIDRQKAAVINLWPLVGQRENFPMALDEPTNRLFIGARRDPTLVVLDTQTGKLIASVVSPRDCDDLFFDPDHQRVILSCGEGFVAVYDASGARHYQPLANITTAPGARTSLYVREWGQLFVAVPHRGQQPAEIRVFSEK